MSRHEQLSVTELTVDEVTAGELTVDEATITKLSLGGVTPAVQQAAIADAASGSTVDAEARTALNDLLAKLRTLGLIAT